MLGRLIKHEFKACMRSCVPVYLAVILSAILVRVFLYIPSSASLVEITRVITAMLYGVLICAVVIMTFIIQLQRFHKNLLGDEGYLMLTLPVSNTQHIMSKSIVALIMDFFAGIVVGISILILVGGEDTFYALSRFFPEMAYYGFTGLHFIEFLLLLIVSSFATTFFLYMCIAIGHTAKRHRTGMAIVAYFGIQFALQFVVSAIGNIIDSANLLNWLSYTTINQTIHIVMLFFIFWSAIYAAVCFFVTRYILNRKLNLE